MYEIVRGVHRDDAWREDKGLMLRDAVGRLSANDVLLAAGCSVPRSAENGSRTVQYIHLFENEHVSMGIFCLPKGSRIPLHNHPGMTVVSRVLRGALHVRSYDWVDHEGRREEGGHVEVGTAVRVFDGVIGGQRDAAQDTTRILFPHSNGNMHEFEAVEDCAVLDVIIPPYDSATRQCTYYRVDGDVGEEDCGEECGALEGGGRVTLREHEVDDVHILTVADLSEHLVA